MPFGALLQSETTIKHFTWCSRAENFVECTKRQCYQLRLSPEACCSNGFDLWPLSKTNLSSKLQWSTCSQFSSSISQGVDWKRSKLCWFYIVPLNTAQIDRKRECLTRNRILARWLCGQIRYLCCVVIHFCTKHLIGLSFDTKRFKF